MQVRAAIGLAREDARGAAGEGAHGGEEASGADGRGTCVSAGGWEQRSERGRLGLQAGARRSPSPGQGRGGSAHLQREIHRIRRTILGSGRFSPSRIRSFLHASGLA
jgi:hypothetical protein